MIFCAIHLRYSRASKLVDEVTTCWGILPLAHLIPEEQSNTVKVPLCIGTLDDPNSHEDLAKFHSKRLLLVSFFTWRCRWNPMLTP